MEWHPGQRLSYEGKRCSIRYFGKIQGKDGLWLGVEWDDETSGKHNGTLDGHKYFQCLSSSEIAASFIRPSRKEDLSVSLLQALSEKYGSPGDLEQAIRISGKTIEEVGFEKIQHQIQNFQELDTIILDKRCISFVGPGYNLEKQVGDLKELQLKARELDLSCNLLETWTDTLDLCAPLKLLQHLDVSGNRFADEIDCVLPKEARHTTLPIKTLNIENMLLTWKQISYIVDDLPNLHQLNASRNNISAVTMPLQGPNITVLDLSYNCIASLEKLSTLSDLSRLSHLTLRGNPIVELTCRSDIIFRSLTRLDLANTQLKDLTTLDNLPSSFPLLNWLLMKDTPLSKLPSATLLTIARVPKLVVLNHVKISNEERQNAEIYYLSTIAKELENTSDVEGEAKVLQNHRQWEDLCRIHGAPKINKPQVDAIDPDTLEARTTIFTFYISKSDCQKANQNYEKKKIARSNNPPFYKTPPILTENPSNDLASKKPSHEEALAKDARSPMSSKTIAPGTSEDISPIPPRNKDVDSFSAEKRDEYFTTAENDGIIEKSALIPRTTSNYALQGIVGRLFALPPPFTTTIRLFLEFDEWVANNYPSSSASNHKRRDKLNISGLAAADTDNKSNGDEESDSDSGWSLSQDDDEVYNDVEAYLRRKREREKERGRWVRRSVELERSTRGVEDFVSWKGFEIGKEARVKVVVV